MDKVRICVLSVAHLHAATYVRCLKQNPYAEIVGFYDDNSERAECFASENNIRCFENFEALAREKPVVALIAAENERHEFWVDAASAAGMDILCEKPLGVRRESMDRMMDLCRKRGVRLYTAMCNRYIHAFRETEEAVKNGRIGRLLAVIATNKGTMPGGWFVDRALSGGGCIIDHTVHVADLMNKLTGNIPERVFAQSGNRLFEMDVEDCAVISMLYPGNILVTLDASWSRTPSFPYGRDLTLRLIGTQGSIFVDYFAERNRIYAPGERITNYYGEDKDQLMLDDLIDAYRTGRTFPISGEDGYRCALVAEAALESARTGKPVSLSQ